MTFIPCVFGLLINDYILWFREVYTLNLTTHILVYFHCYVNNFSIIFQETFYNNKHILNYFNFAAYVDFTAFRTLYTSFSFDLYT